MTCKRVECLITSWTARKREEPFPFVSLDRLIDDFYAGGRDDFKMANRDAEGRVYVPWDAVEIHVSVSNRVI